MRPDHGIVEAGLRIANAAQLMYAMERAVEAGLTNCYGDDPHEWIGTVLRDIDMSVGHHVQPVLEHRQGNGHEVGVHLRCDLRVLKSTGPESFLLDLLYKDVLALGQAA